MGTRSLTIFKDEDRELCVLYRQMDGYLSCHGADLAKILSNKRIVNGFGSDNVLRGDFNGIADLAVQTITLLKIHEGENRQAWDKESKRPVCPLISTGGFYLMPAGTRDQGEEFIYTIEAKPNGDPWITVENGKRLFSGTPEDLAKKAAKSKP